MPRTAALSRPLRHRKTSSPPGAKRSRVRGREPKSFGQSLAKIGCAVGAKIIEAYRAVDPDVARHLMQIPLLSYSLFSSTEEVIHRGRPDGHRPVVFVHGLGGSRGDFLLMSTYFWMRGRRRSYRIHFERNQTIPQMSRTLSRFVKKVARVTGERKVDIVAHSLGGVVSRLALVDHGLSRHVATLVTLGSPHQGTHSARFGNTATVRELRPGSDLLARLARKRWPSTVHGICFWSRSDLMVVPAESAIAPGTQPVDATPFTHYSYLIDPKSWSAVRAAIARPRRAPRPTAL